MPVERFHMREHKKGKSMNKKLKLVALLLASGGLLASCQSGTGDSSTSGGASSSGDPTSSWIDDGSSSTEESSSSAQNYTRASGTINFTGLDTENKSELLGELESYALKHHLAGIPLYDDAGIELFSPRITLKSDTYITNYGFGVGESTLNPNGAMYNGNTFAENLSDGYPQYFHGYATEDSGTYNYWNSSGSDVSAKSSMITAGYFEVEMDTSTSTGYKWTNLLAKTERPIRLTPTRETATDSSGNQVALTPGDLTANNYYTEEAVEDYVSGTTSQYWRIYINTGADETDDVKYRYSTTSSFTDSSGSSFNGRLIEAEDYLTPFKAMLDNRLSRYSGLIADSSGFVGAYDYAAAGDTSDDAWDSVGIQLGSRVDENGDTLYFLDFTFITPLTQFYAMYNTASGLYSPIPEDFVDACGGAANYGKIGTSSDPTKNCDYLISCGPYVVTSWESSKNTVYQKNATYCNASTINYEGYAEKVYENEEAAFQDFLNGLLDEVTVPSKYISQYSNDAYAHKTLASTTIKANVNSCTEEEWEYYFGTNGTIYPHTLQEYWDVKPIMSNDDFLNGVFFCINRAELAAKNGRNPAVGYLSSAYMIDPENDVAYRDTDAGKAALADYTSVNEYAYSTSLATQLFKRAAAQLIADGDYEEDTEITLTYLYRVQDTIDLIGDMIKGYIENTFNAACAEYGLTLVIENKVAGSSYTDCYTMMDQGEYDFGEGAISGNVLNPLEFMSVICTNDKSQGFCVNWGERTDQVSDSDPCLFPLDPTDPNSEEVAWSYDALYDAANGAAIVDNGVTLDPIDGYVVGDNSATYVHSESADETTFSTSYLDDGYCAYTLVLPGTADSSGDPLITYDIQEMAVFGGYNNGMTDGGFYLDSITTVNQWDRGIDLIMRKDRLTSYLNRLVSDSFPTINQAVIYTIIKATYAGTSKTITTLSYVNLSELGIDNVTA